MSAQAEPYLLPYLDAAKRFGAGFGALLWASPKTQRFRFEALRGAYDPSGKSVLDVGCGRADYLLHLLDHRIEPADYTGIEAVECLAESAVANIEKVKDRLPARIVAADFVREPRRMFVGADIVMFSGSLNTLDTTTFYATLKRAYDATAEALVFNFLCSPFLAGREYLTWHHADHVLRFVEGLGGVVKANFEYLRGDGTICIRKPIDTSRDR